MSANRSQIVLALSSIAFVTVLATASVAQPGPPPRRPVGNGAPPPPPPPRAPQPPPRGGGGNPPTPPNGPTLSNFLDDSGQVSTLDVIGPLDNRGPFFMPLGTNGRACISCHQPSQAWSITPEGVQTRFNSTQGHDPIFRLVDGANSPDADVSTLQARRDAYSMLLSKGLIRIGLPIPSGAQFVLDAVDDPYNYATAKELSLFRRPLPTTNFRFLSAVMWDGRETVTGQTIDSDLGTQALDAVIKHEQALTNPTANQINTIVTFENALYTAQTIDNLAGSLTANGATGGPIALSTQRFFPGINDPAGLNPTGAAFNPVVFNLFASWATPPMAKPTSIVLTQQSIARGQAIFNHRQFQISGVGGLNDVIHVASFAGTCSTCHDSPNVGNHSIGDFLDIGQTDGSRRTPDMPLYTLRNIVTGQTRETTDPGRALVTGKWADIGKTKVPILRGLAGRSPYFHNGSAASAGDVVDFYNMRFRIGLSPQDQKDLANFIETL